MNSFNYKLQLLIYLMEFQLFLLHLDSTLAPPDAEDDLWKDKTNTGCTTLILSNPNSQQVNIPIPYDPGFI